MSAEAPLLGYGARYAVMIKNPYEKNPEQFLSKIFKQLEVNVTAALQDYPIYSISFNVETAGKFVSLIIFFDDAAFTIDIEKLHATILDNLKALNLKVANSDKYYGMTNLYLPTSISIFVSDKIFETDNGIVLVSGRSLSGVHKQLINVNCIILQDTIKSNILGLLLIDNLVELNFTSKEVRESNRTWTEPYKLARLEKMDLLEFKAMLIENGLSQYAKL
jgi:hypothetical protein